MLSEREEYILQSKAKKELTNDLRRKSIHLAEMGKESISEYFPDVDDIH
jgi:hypothetical protein